MKRSNLLLSTLVLVSIILLVSLTFVVSRTFDQYKFNYKDNNSAVEFVKLSPAKVISLSNLRNIKILSSDSLRIEFPKKGKNMFDIRSAGDTLFVQSLSLEAELVQDSVQITLYVPSGTSMTMDSCGVELKGDFDVDFPSSFSLQLSNTELKIPAGDYREFFDSLSIEDRGGSSVVIGERAFIVNVVLKNVHSARFANAYHISNLVTTVEPIASVQ